MDMSTATIEQTQSNVCMHQFIVMTHKLNCKGVVLKMKNSIFIWIGNTGDSSSFSNLSFSSPNPYQSMPLYTSIMSLGNDELSNRIAVTLSKKLGKPVWISVNLNIDSVNEPELEKQIKDEIAAHPENF